MPGWPSSRLAPPNTYMMERPFALTALPATVEYLALGAGATCSHVFGAPTSAAVGPGVGAAAVDVGSVGLSSRHPASREPIRIGRAKE
jgi:hypothetical protein